MADYTELKRLAEHHLSLGHAYTVATPSAVLALIAENERLVPFEEAYATACNVRNRLIKENELLDRLVVTNKALSDSFRAERDQLKAEIAGLKTGYEACERVNAELKAENEVLRAKWENPDPILIQCMDAAIAEQEQLEKYAGRYQWLRDKQTFIWLIQDWFPSDAEFTDVDAVIDAAMDKGEQS